MADSKVKIEKFDIPKEVAHVTEALRKGGFEAYLVGGCVRDLFMGRKPKDWDITTNARPEQIIPLFPKTFYENDYGTVAVVNEEARPDGTVGQVSDETLKIIEITPYRTEKGYSDHRRPDEVVFSQNILDDLKRRDFTINAIAYDPETGEIVDPFAGVADLARGIIKAVGDPKERFFEDGLRIMRGVRLHVELALPIEPSTEIAILENKEVLNNVSRERIRDEFIKIVMSPRPMDGLLLLQKLGLLSIVSPELEQAIGVEQNQAHAYDVWTHLLKTLQHSATKGYPLHVRLAALFHDIAKPATRRFDEAQKQWTFYGHEVVGSHVTKKILENLRFSRETIDKTTKLIRWHMFFSDTEQITLSAVRRLVAKVGQENIWDLINVRLCDRIGTGRPKENPYRLRKYTAMIEQVLRDPITVGMLKIDGRKVIEVGEMGPGPKIGQVLNALLQEVLEKPELNTEEYLEKRTKELLQLPDKELQALGQEGKEKKEEKELAELGKINKKYFVS